MVSSNQRGKIGGIPSAAVLFGIITLFAIVSLGWNANQSRSTSTASSLSVTGKPTQLYVLSEANIRDRATSQGSNIVGKLASGHVVEGVVEQGEVSGNLWLRLSNGSGFVSVVNLSSVAPIT